MRVFLQEWKKIWRPGILVALLVLGLAYFYLFSNFYIEYFCNGPTAQAEFDLASEWVETYGPTMEPEERQALDQQLEEEKATFAQEIADYGPAAALGITTYDAFASYQQAYYTAVQEQDGEADMETEQFLHKMMDNTNYYRITELENYLSAYDGKADTPWSQQEGFLSYTGEEQAQIQRLEDGGRGFCRMRCSFPPSTMPSIWPFGLCSVLCFSSHRPLCGTASITPERFSGPLAPGGGFGRFSWPPASAGRWC